MYIDAQYNKFKDEVIVWERTENGRKQKRYPAPYYFYVKDENGEFNSIFDEKLRKLEFKTRFEFDDELERMRLRGERTYEADIQPELKVLMNNYYRAPLPKLHVGFIDIEVDYQSENGWSRPTNPYAPVNAITIYASNTKTYYVLGVPPPEFVGSEFESIKRSDTKIELFKNEKLLLERVFEIVDDLDVMSGWNSDFFDMPYLMKRTEIAMSESHLKLWTFKDARSPSYAEAEQYGEVQLTVRLTGRQHLDYLNLFKKFNLQGRQSYSLEAIAAEELDIPKHQYNGTLEDLYHDNFEEFLFYNRRDVEVLVALEKKFRYIELANQYAHDATCPLTSVFGTVKITDTSIINYAHEIGRIVPTANHSAGPKIEGAVVLTPKPGLYEWLGSVDVNSLYPSTFRSINISMDRIIGQFVNYESDWRGIVNDEDRLFTMRFENGDVETATAAEWKEMFTQLKWCISAFGTVFDQSRGPGIVAAVLAKWYAERKQMQAEKKKWSAKADKLKKELGVDISSVDDPQSLVSHGGFVINKERIYTVDEWAQIEEAEETASYYDRIQHSKKIALNSLYGASINAGSKFYDHRYGASCTAVGRQVTLNMLSTINEINCGRKIFPVRTEVFDKKGERSVVYEFNDTDNTAIYSDTDSAYFSIVDPTLDNVIRLIDKAKGEKVDASYKVDDVSIGEMFSDFEKYKVDIYVLMADLIAEIVNNSFKPFMQKSFLCTEGFDDLIKVARETVADKGLFITKKKYILRCLDIEGKRVDKFKSQGSASKKSDTPVSVQKFMSDIIDMVLRDGKTKDEVYNFVDERRTEILEKSLLEVAAIKSANKLSQYNDIVVNGTKGTVPGHVRAAINFNICLDKFKDRANKPIISGDKVRVLYLQPNGYGYKSMAFPVDLDNFPEWFIEHFAVDSTTMEEKIDDKLKEIFKGLAWELPNRKNLLMHDLFDF